MNPIVRNIQNNDLYKYLGGNKFQNLRTGQTGEVPDETAKKIFKINVELSQIIKDNPIVEKAISKLNLRYDD